MGQSYRKPYASWCGHKHYASKDKRIAARGVRRTQETALRQALKEDAFEDFLMPHIYECPHNNVWNWVRDGNQRLRFDESPKSNTKYGIGISLEDEGILAYAKEWNDDHHAWWLYLQRK